MYRHIIKCKSDEFYIDFYSEREREVFISMHRKMEQAIKMHIDSLPNNTHRTYDEFKFDTTLECQIAGNYTLDLRKALDLDVLNIFNKDSVVMIKYRSKIREESA
jgi:hypothetical protein